VGREDEAKGVRGREYWARSYLDVERWAYVQLAPEPEGAARTGATGQKVGSYESVWSDENRASDGHG
jgi:hypothetical protein